jgi:hypothetical protein
MRVGLGPLQPRATMHVRSQGQGNDRGGSIELDASTMGLRLRGHASL